MTAYSATFADGTKKTLKNSRAEYAAAWKVTVRCDRSGVFSVSGFSRDAAVAEKSSGSEASRLTRKDRWSPKGRELVSREVVEIVRG